MRSKWLLGFVAASALSAPAFGQIQIYIGTPPPPVRYEVLPPLPGDGYIWSAGYWEPYGPRYRWVPGRYVVAPYPEAYWTPARYEHDDRGWKFHKGYWVRRGNRHFDRDDDDDDHGHGHGHGHEHGHGHDRD